MSTLASSARDEVVRERVRQAELTQRSSRELRWPQHHRRRRRRPRWWSPRHRAPARVQAVAGLKPHWAASCIACVASRASAAAPWWCRTSRPRRRRRRAPWRQPGCWPASRRSGRCRAPEGVVAGLSAGRDARWGKRASTSVPEPDSLPYLRHTHGKAGSSLLAERAREGPKERQRPGGGGRECTNHADYPMRPPTPSGQAREAPRGR
jgi:hypothetical protein